MTGELSDSRTVLIVDDLATTRQILTYTLTSAGYRTLQAADGLQAIQLAADHRVDLILLDIMLPGIDGLKVLERLRGKPETKAITVIAVTESHQKRKSSGRWCWVPTPTSSSPSPMTRSSGRSRSS